MDFEEFVARRARGLSIEEEPDDDLHPSKAVSSGRVDCSLAGGVVAVAVVYEAPWFNDMVSIRRRRGGSGRVFTSGGWTHRRDT